MVPYLCKRNIYYRLQTKLQEGYVFTGVCLSMEGGGYIPMDYTLRWKDYPLPGRSTLSPEGQRDAAGSGYASYWNAFFVQDEMTVYVG